MTWEESLLAVVSMPFDRSRGRHNFNQVRFALGPDPQVRVAAVLQIAKRAKFKSPSATALDTHRNVAGCDGGTAMLVDDLVAAARIGALHDQGKTIWIPGGLRDGQGPRVAKVRGQPLHHGVGPRSPYGREIEPGDGDARQDGEHQYDSDHFHQRVPTAWMMDAPDRSPG